MTTAGTRHASGYIVVHGQFVDPGGGAPRHVRWVCPLCKVAQLTPVGTAGQLPMPKNPNVTSVTRERIGWSGFPPGVRHHCGIGWRIEVPE